MNPNLFDITRLLLANKEQDDQFQPNHQAFDQLSNTISQLPDRNPNPSFARQLGGDIIGMGAGLHSMAVVGGQPIGANYDPIKANIASDNFVQAPYHDKMDDIASKVKLMEPLANAENSQNQNKLSLFNANENRKVQGRTQQRLEAKDQEIADQNDVKNKLNEDKLAEQKRVDDAKIFAQTHLDFKSVTDKNGELIFYNPKDPKQTFKSGIETGKLSDLDKLELRHSDRMVEIKASGEEARTTKATPSAGTSQKDMLPTQQNALVQKRSQQALAEHPEWKDYVSLNPQTNKYEVKMPKNGDQNILNRVNTFVYGKDAERVRVIRKEDGQSGTISKEAYEAHKDKYTLAEDK